MYPEDLLNGIAVENADMETGNVVPLLHELLHALRALLEHGTEHAVDLRSLPLTASEEKRLESLLGSGEVRADVATLGTSEVKETSISGIWLVTHYNEDSDVIGKYIEVTRCPWLLSTQEQDLAAGLLNLERLLEE